MKNSLFLISPLLFLCGCSTFQPVKDSAIHHVLDPLVPDRALTSSTPTIAINRPSIPSYLDRQQLITRTEGAIMMSKLDLWAEPLDAAISRVTASNLSRLTGSMAIRPVENFTTLDYSTLLELQITQFEPDNSSQMILQGTWKLQPVSGEETSAHFFRIVVPIPSNPSPMTGRVNAMNQALESLAREIANKLQVTISHSSVAGH
ncbi:MAG: PqiC family protein [Verrucomicrobia bacterium]|nr:PqiC family protein [Verrucomicrobiota bacterium]